MIISTNLFKELLEEPHSLMQSSTSSFKFLALSLIASPSFPAISLLIAFSISPLSNSFSNSRPTLHTWLTYLAFTLWSPKHGLHIIGIPSQILSRVEFQPQWLKNPPTALCAKTSFCGAQFTMQPLSPTVSLKIWDNTSFFEPRIESGRNTHKKRCWLLASPHAISTSSFSSMAAMLPKLTYITEFLVCFSSHAMQLVSSFNKLLLGGPGPHLCRGPMGRFGTWYCCWIRANDDSSRQSIVFQMITDEDVLILYISITSCEKVSNFLLLGKGRSLNLRGWWLGTRSCDTESEIQIRIG